MPKWNDGLVDAFPIPLDHQLSKLKISDGETPDQNTPQYEPTDPFPFFSLPAELRNRIYNLVLFSKPGYRGANGKRKGSRLAVLLASKRFHLESSYTLYTTHKFLIFPVQLFNALPTIQELPPHYRLFVTNLEMVVGSSWTSPPKSWRVSTGLAKCLRNLKNVQTLSLFVDFDPSHPAFMKYRISYEFYTDFCGELLEDVLDAMPQLQYVQIDGNTGVDVHGPLVSRLREEALAQDKHIRWGKEAGWSTKFADGVAREVHKATEYEESMKSTQDDISSVRNEATISSRDMDVSRPAETAAKKSKATSKMKNKNKVKK